MKLSLIHVFGVEEEAESRAKALNPWYQMFAETISLQNQEILLPAFVVSI